MRRFIYYDKDGIESYLAQITSGILVSTTEELSKGQEKEQSKTKETITQSDINAKLAGIGAEIKEDVTIGTSELNATSQLVRSLEEKVLSDYAFDKVYDYFTKQGFLKTSDFKIGDVVSLEENVVFFDFNYFESIFSENGVSNFSIKQEKENLKELKNSLTTEQKRNLEIKNRIKQIEQAIKKQEEERRTILEVLNMAKVTLPYIRFIMTKECLVVLNDESFRDNPNNVAFKYGGNIQIVGYVTNIINSENNESSEPNIFSDMYKTVNQVLLNLYNDAKTIYVIHPLAMFY